MISYIMRKLSYSVVRLLKVALVPLFLVLLSFQTEDSFAQANFTQVSFNDALVDAADREAETIVSQLLRSSYPADSKGKFGVTALMRAAYRGNTRIAELLLNVNANPNIVDIGGATALHLASREGKADMVRLLIKYNAFVDMADNDGWTPLMRAALAGHKEVVTNLIDAGADINAANTLGETPLMQAIQRRNQEIVKLLLDKGADPDERNTSGFSVLDIAKRKRDTVIENMIRTSLDGNAPKAEIANNLPASMRHKNFQLEVKENKEAPPQQVATTNEPPTTEDKIQIMERMNAVLSSEPKNEDAPKKTSLTDYEAVEMPKSMQPSNWGRGIKELDSMPWITNAANGEEILRKENENIALNIDDVEKKIDEKAHQAIDEFAKTPGTADDPYKTKSAAEVTPIPLIRPYKPINADKTPWLAEKSQQQDLISKLRELEAKIPSLKEPEKENTEKELSSTPAEAAVAADSTEPESKAQQAAVSAKPEKKIVAATAEATPETTEKKAAKDLAQLPTSSSKKTTPENDQIIQEPKPESKKQPVEQKNPVEIASAPMKNVFLQDQEEILEENTPDKSPEATTQIVESVKAEPVKEEPVEGRPWLTPAELKDNVPDKISMAQEKAKLEQQKDTQNQPAGNEPEQEEDHATDAIIIGKQGMTYEKDVKKEFPKQLPKKQETARAEPAQISPESLLEKADEPIQPKAKITEEAIEEDESVEEGDTSAKVEVSEAIRVPLSAPQKVSVDRSTDSQPANILPSNFSPSGKDKKDQYWLEIRKFETEAKAISYFEEITARDKLYLRMRVIKPAVQNAREQQVSLRVGTFSSNKEAADVCLSFKTEELQCAIVKDTGRSAPAKTAQRFRFGFERGTYQNEYAITTPPGSDYYWVQLGTFNNEFDAISHWQILRRNHADVLDPLKVNLTTPQRSSAASQSLRLRAGPFMAKAEANDTCRRLKKRHISCLAVSGK